MRSASVKLSQAFVQAMQQLRLASASTDVSQSVLDKTGANVGAACRCWPSSTPSCASSSTMAPQTGRASCSWIDELLPSLTMCAWPRPCACTDIAASADSSRVMQ